MGRVRAYEFDAVIGIGGVGYQARSHGINGRINWIGKGPFEVGRCDRGYPQIAFEHFVLYEERGKKVSEVAPALARRFCHAKAPRFAVDEFSESELAEIAALLKKVGKEPPSPGLFKPVARQQCRPRHHRSC